MRSRLVKESLPGLPRTNDHNIKPKPRSYLHRPGCSPTIRTLFLVLFVSLGLSLVIFSGPHRFWYHPHPTTANAVLAHFTSKPPLINRAILEKISRLDPDEPPNSDFSIPINIINSEPSYFLSPFQRRLPRVTRIPEVQPQAPPDLEMETPENRSRSEGNADDRFPSSRKYLLPVKIEERGANARVNLAQLLEFARALNRTLVLPNVGKNRVGACRRWRFGVYYDERALSERSDEDPDAFIRQDRFRAWVDSLASPPSLRLVFLGRAHPKSYEQIDSSLGVYIHNNSDTTTIVYSQTGCLNKKFPRLDLNGSSPPLSLVVDDSRRQKRDSGSVSQMLLEKLSELTLLALTPSEPALGISPHPTGYVSNHAPESPEVLAISWNVPIPIFQPHPTLTVDYSPQLRSLAARLVRRLGPYIAVAWDIETSKVDSVLGCMEALRSTLRYVLSSGEPLEIRNIWLAGNLSPSELVNSSESFCESTFKDELFFASYVRMTGVGRELAGMVKEGEEVDDLANNGDEMSQKRELLNDAGVLEILDKLVSMRSTIFVTASESCGKTSTLAKEVLDWRGENAEFFFGGEFGPGGDTGWGRTERVVMDNGVIEFG